MDAAFVLTVSAGVRPPAERGSGVGSSPGRHVLGFEVGGHRRWTDRTGHLTLEVWRAADGPEPWYEAADGIAVVAGQPWWRGPSWSRSELWPQEMWERGAEATPSDLRRQLGGMHASLRLTGGGDGWVAADPLGQRCLYFAESGDDLLVGSRAALVAAAAAGPARTPERDLAATAWLAFMGFRAGGRTGFSGVRSFPAHTALSLQAGRPRWDTESAVDVPADDPSRQLPLAEHAEAVLDELGTVMRATLSRSASGHVIQLTGGKDSRVMLAAAIRAGVAHEFTFETIGPPKLDDVRIAAALTDRFGLRHDVRFLGLKPKSPYAERAREFVDLTAAGLNLWDIDSQVGKGEIRLTGVVGAALRASRRLPVGDPDEVLRRTFPRDRFDRLGVLPYEVADGLHQDLMAEVLAPAGRSHHDRLQAWYIANEPKFSRLAARLEIPGDIKLPVLPSWPIVRASSSIDPLDRQDEVLVAEALRQVSPHLLDIAFTDAGWPPRAQAHLDGEPPPPPPSLLPSLEAATPPGASRNTAGVQTGTRKSKGGGSKSTSLVERLGSRIDERVGLLAEVFADSSNPAWILYDRAVALNTLERYEELTNMERKALFGVATAAMWMDG